MTIQFPQVDWATLIPTIVGLFFSSLGTSIQKSLQDTFGGLGSSGANVLTQTPLDMTWQLGPITASIADIQNASRAVLIFAAILLGLRGMLSSIVPNQIDMLGEGVNGILASIILTAAFPALVPEIIQRVNDASGAIGGAALAGLMTPGGGGGDPIGTLIMFIALLFFGFRLLVKTVWRIGFLATMLPIGMAACLLYAIPPLRWILGWWSRMWGGMLVAQVPSTLAIVIGLEFVAHATGTLVGFVYSIAFLQLAHDLYDLIPFGSSRSHGSLIGALGTAAAWARMGFGAVGGGGASAAEALTVRPQLAADMAANSTRYGY